jgi:hypothetical protein
MRLFGHKLGLLHMTSPSRLRVVSLAGSGNSLSGSPSNTIHRRAELTLALSSIIRRNRMSSSCLHIGESPQSSSFQLPGCCSFCCRMTLILIKHGIKRASFHRACHRAHPRKAFPMGLALVHMFSSGPFLPGYRQDDVKDLPR